MLVNTGIKLTEDEINNALNIINYASAADRAMKFAFFESTEDSIVEEYYKGVSIAFIESRVMLNKWRNELSKKYGIPYSYTFNNGQIFIDKEED